MKRIVIAIGLIEQGDDYLLQYRNGSPETGEVGKIGGFGGKLEDGEDPKEAMIREISEETTLDASQTKLQILGKVEVISDYRLEPTKVTAHIFLVVLQKDDPVEAKEGVLVRVPKDEIKSRLSDMSPATKALFEQYVLNERRRS